MKINIKNKESEYKKLVSEKEERKLKESNINSFIETLKDAESELVYNNNSAATEGL
ncbi:MAG: hypothetical protein IAC58_06170 [Firmicutes bacterium]|uniref:Uncharacterized protein n=1 Tax=Candidatus Onthovivens merdipullorum TaxID=2840889 RepID=A0A9D9GY13_9BACL|nr:hypothetical protein [Candidatus Onthovivens merdipullorum]